LSTRVCSMTVVEKIVRAGTFTVKARVRPL
jgi:hypothetical protein